MHKILFISTPLKPQKITAEILFKGREQVCKGNIKDECDIDES